MIYDIGVRIAQKYDRPANTGRHLLRLMPPSIAGQQQVIEARLTLEPEPDERSERADFFGNGAVEIAYNSPHEDLVFNLSCRVDRNVAPRVPAALVPLSAMPAAIAAQASLDAKAPHHFCGRSPRVGPTREMTAYAEALVRPDTAVTDAVRVIGRALHGDMTFDAEATNVDTPPEQAFAGKRGVCQDFAHIMIACLRGVGVPAGYVSGFLRTIPPPGKPRLAGADSMHAWVMAWCGPEAGWIEFDPTNNLAVENDHIVVGHGRDYSDVAPVKGVLRTSGSQSTEQSVDVVPAGEAR